MSSVGSVGNELFYSAAWEMSGVFSGSLIGQSNYVNLKQIDNQIFFQQNVLFGNSKELQFRTCGLMANHKKLQRYKGEHCSFINLGGAIVNKVPVRDDVNLV